jgi:hypothetical protein
MVANQIQEWAIEELWATTATNWPRCPRHPDSHPTKASTREATAVWTCPADELVISTIGELYASSCLSRSQEEFGSLDFGAAARSWHDGS